MSGYKQVMQGLGALFSLRTRLYRWHSEGTRRKLIEGYIRSGRIPWSRGYIQYRTQYITAALADAEILGRFAQSKSLPAGYGAGLDERCVEYPWIISRLETEPSCCLDAGSALNHVHILDHPVFRNKKLHLLTLAPEAQSFWQRGVSYLYEDLRQIPIRDNFYDIVISISTLEHVGFDNSLFAINPAYAQNRPDDFTIATRELWRVLKPGGQLLVTVPFGAYRNFGTFQQFDLPLLHRLESSVKAITIERTFYEYTRQGWGLSDATTCAHNEYFSWCMLPPNQRPKRMPENPDGAAAARAVACVKLVRPT